VHKRRLHARQHVLDTALVDVARHRMVGFPLQKQLHHTPVFEHRGPRFAEAGVDDDLPCHSSMSLLNTSKQEVAKLRNLPLVCESRDDGYTAPPATPFSQAHVQQKWRTYVWNHDTTLPRYCQRRENGPPPAG